MKLEVRFRSWKVEVRNDSMNITAEIKYLHISPKKIKALGHVLVGLAPVDAINRLTLQRGKREKLLLSAIKSAAANAQNNFKLDPRALKIKTIEILKGPFMKRWQPVSRGIAHQIKKRMSHIKVTLVKTANGKNQKLGEAKKGSK